MFFYFAPQKTPCFLFLCSHSIKEEILPFRLLEPAARHRSSARFVTRLLTFAVFWQTRWTKRRARQSRSNTRQEDQKKRDCSLHVPAAHLEFQPPAGRGGLRDARGERRRGEARPLPLVTPGGAVRLRSPREERVCPARAGSRGLSRGKLPRALPHTREPQIHKGLTREAAGALARGALPGGWETPWASLRTRGQVPRPKEVSIASDDMGRRTENALLQGEDAASLERVVPAGPLP